MDLLLSEEQGMLQDSARRRLLTVTAVLIVFAISGIRIRNLIAVFGPAEAGWMAIVTPEINGGLGLGLTELCLIAEQMGKGLMPDPVTAVAAVAGAVEDRAGGNYHR